LKLGELCRQVEDLELTGVVLIPYKKTTMYVERISQFGIIPVVTIRFSESGIATGISVENFQEVIRELVSNAPGWTNYVDIELWYGEEKCYSLNETYQDHENLYLCIG